jgi:hypothetical protein
MAATDARPRGGNRTSTPNGDGPNDHALAIREPALDGEVLPPRAPRPEWRTPSREEADDLAERINTAHAELVQGIRTTCEKAAAVGR